MTTLIALMLDTGGGGGGDSSEAQHPVGCRKLTFLLSRLANEDWQLKHAPTPASGRRVSDD